MILYNTGASVHGLGRDKNTERSENTRDKAESGRKSIVGRVGRSIQPDKHIQ